jgi:predicted phosphodiesterase
MITFDNSHNHHGNLAEIQSKMRIGIVTDIHENTAMLSEALRQASVYKCDEIVCLGDIVGFDHRFYTYTPLHSAKGCLDLVRSSCRWIVPGNHDLFAAKRVPSYTNGFEYPENWFSMDLEDRRRISRGRIWTYDGETPNDLEEEDLIFLRSLPEYIILPFSGADCLFSHYIYPDFTGSTTQYIERNNHLTPLWDFLDRNKIIYSFSGHSHNHFAGLAYRGGRSFFKAIHSVPSQTINLGNEMVLILLPPVAGEKGRTGFSIIDSDSLKLEIIAINIV